MNASRFLMAMAVMTVACGLISPCPARADLLTSFQENAVLSDQLSGKLTRESFPTPALGGNRRVYIYTPPGYSPTSTRTYPVIVLLHGSPGDPVDWLYQGHAHRRLDTAIQQGKFPACLLVVPDGHGPFYKGGSEWADSVDGRYRMETAMTRDLPNYLKTRYRVSTNPALWTLGGLSEGGYGAANLVVRHPDVFRNAIILSGDLTVSDDWGDTTQVFGDDTLNRLHNSPAFQIRHLSPAVRSQLHFYLAVGAEDEASLISENESFAATCRSLDIPVQFDCDQGNHKWGFWGNHLEIALNSLGGWLRKEGS